MSDSLAVELTKQIGAIVSSAIWPLVFLVLIVRFGPTFARSFNRMTEIIFKGGGVEISAKVAQEIVANLSAAEASKATNPDASTEVQTPAPRTDLVRKAIYSADTVGGWKKMVHSATILWVDDRPEKNAYEMDALKGLGISIDVAKSTAEADSLLKRRHYDLIITDLKRGTDTDAGMNFMKYALAKNPSQKIIVYTGYAEKNKMQAAISAGAKGATNSPSELFQLVVANLQ